jgi:hypothetical protein
VAVSGYVTAHIKKGQPPLPYFHFSSIPGRPPFTSPSFILVQEAAYQCRIWQNAVKESVPNHKREEKSGTFSFIEFNPLSVVIVRSRPKATEFNLVSAAREYSVLQDRPI